MSKNGWPILSSNTIAYTMGQNFLDIQYMQVYKRYVDQYIFMLTTYMTERMWCQISLSDSIYIWITVCPRSPISYSNLLHKMGQDFLDIQYNLLWLFATPFYPIICSSVKVWIHMRAHKWQQVAHKWLF